MEGLESYSKWKVDLGAKYSNKVFRSIVQLVAQSREVKIDPEKLWTTTVRLKTIWVHKMPTRESWCMESPGNAVENIRKELNIPEEVKAISSEDLILGTKLFAVILYCPKHVVESAKLAVFYGTILTNQSLRTIIQSTMNNMNPKYNTTTFSLATIKEFYKNLDSVYNFNLGSVSVALLAKETLAAVLDQTPPYMGNHTQAIQLCIQEKRCDDAQALIQQLGEIHFPSIL